MDMCRSCGEQIPKGLSACPRCGGTAIPSSGARRPFFAVGERAGGRFVVQALLGAGSSGAVYDVLDELVGRRAALKVLWDEADERADSFQRLRREVLAAQAIRDESIVAVHDLLIVEGRPALLMERVEGKSLREKILSDGPLEYREAARIIEKVLGAIKLLHGSGIIHRDVKSGNILLADDGAVKLGDFGLAKGDSLGATLTATGATLGTPGYMAPELIKGQDASAISDLYSAGVVLFEMLAGRLPFEGTSGLHVAHMHVSERPPLELLKRNGIPKWLIHVTSRLLEKESRDRYISAEEAITALESRRSAGAAFRIAKLVRAHGAALAGIGALALAAAVLALWGSRSNGTLSLSFHDNVLEARNSSGGLAWKKTLPRNVQSACFGRFGPGGSPAAACAVAWDDKAGEVEPPVGGSAVWVFDGTGHELEKIPLPSMGKGFNLHFEASLSSHRFAANEPERLVVYARHHTWHPTGLFIYSFKGARPWNVNRMTDLSFINSGALAGWSYRDLDGDGIDDIVCAGINMPLFWTDFVAGLKVGPPSEHLANLTSPDINFGLNSSPLFYHLFSFELLERIRLLSGPAGEPLLAMGNRAPWAIGPKGEIEMPGWRAPVQSKESEFNGMLSQLAFLRDNGKWADLLGQAEELPSGLSPVHDWIRRLYKAAALAGLDRPADAQKLILGEKSGEIPIYADQMLLDATFLEGRYQEAQRLYFSFPDTVRAIKPELGNTVLLSALCDGNGKDLPKLAASRQIASYNWYPSMLEGAQLCLQDAPVAGERAIRSMGGEMNQEAGPRLWLAECLLREGKIGEARQALEEARPWREESPREFDEEEIWLSWCSGKRDQAAIQRFSVLADEARAEARTSPRARAFLPVTLAKYAAMLMACGQQFAGRKTLEESLRLSPQTWRDFLKAVPARK